MVFDTYAYVKKLKAAGVTQEQAEVHAEAIADLAGLIEDRLATKRDLQELEDNLKRDMKELELRLIIKLGVLITVAIGVVTTLVKLL